MIEKVVKGCLGFVAGIIVIFVVVAGIVWGIIAYFVDDAQNAHERPANYPLECYDDVPHMMDLYETAQSAPRGAYCRCAVCDKYFYKGDIVCCSRECESTYRDLVTMYNNAEKR